MSDNIVLAIVAAVRDFMVAFDQTFYSTAENTPCEIAALRSSLIREEYGEYNSSPSVSVDELDAICDLLYVIAGTALTFNVPLHPYISGQLYGSRKVKHDISTVILPILQDLDSRFPCTRIQNQWLNAATRRIIDVAKMNGYDLPAAFVEVHRSNMTKLWKEPPKELYNIKQKKGGWLVKRPEDGKVIKSPTYSPADLKPYI